MKRTEPPLKCGTMAVQINISLVQYRSCRAIFLCRVRIGKYNDSCPVLRHWGDGLGGPYKFLSELGPLRCLCKGPFLFCL